MFDLKYKLLKLRCFHIFFYTSHALQGAQRSCCACASTFPTSYGISTASRMQYLPILSSSCRPLWQTPPLSEMGKPKSPPAHCCLLNLLRLSNPEFPSLCFKFSLPGDWCDHGLGHTFLTCTGAFDPWETTWCDCVSTKLPLCRWADWKISFCLVQLYTESFRSVFFPQVWVWQLAWPYCRWAAACSFVRPPLAPRRKTMKMTLLPLCRNV